MRGGGTHTHTHTTLSRFAWRKGSVESTGRSEDLSTVLDGYKTK